jgi:3-isopropylmalate dehydrogenase
MARDMDSRVPKEQLSVSDRLQMSTHMRPCEYLPGGKTPLRGELVKDAKFIVLRENCGGAFYGPKVEEPASLP